MCLILAGGSVCCALAAAEVGLRVFMSVSKSKTTTPFSNIDAVLESLSLTGTEQLQVLCGDCPYIFQLNPAHKEVNELGFRNKEFSVSKPAGTTRIFCLGDSVTHGIGVEREKTFSALLDEHFQKTSMPAECINAGVNMYTAYNALQFYINRVRYLSPDIVVFFLCMNDIADPLLHWEPFNITHGMIPPESIPNYDRHLRIKSSFAKNQSGELSSPKSYLNKLAEKSALYQFVFQRVGTIKRKMATHAFMKGVWWPVFITGEDTIRIETLCEYDSAEWTWLRGILDRFIEETTRDGVVFVLAVLPLEYQLREGYPYMPQKLFRRYCLERSVLYLDLLPAFIQHRNENLFLTILKGMHDIWHLSEAGHELVAQELGSFLHARGLMKNPAEPVSRHKDL